MKIVVYTCITGNYDSLREVPKQFFENFLDFVCFTDNPNLKSETWQIRMIPEELTSLTKVKQQRIIKICPHKFFKDYDASLWIDGNIEITGVISTFLKNYNLNAYSLYALKHPKRNCIYDEEKAVLALKKDIASITYPQIQKYVQDKFPKNYGLIESRILYRRHNDNNCMNLMLLWANEILKGSHRDQLSFNYCCWKMNFKYGLFDSELVRKNFKWYLNHEKEISNNSNSVDMHTVNFNSSDLTNAVDSVDIYTVNFNHSELTNAWIKSVIKNVSGINYRIFVVDNSDKVPFKLDETIDKSLVNIIDNTDDKIIPVRFATKYFSKKFIPANNNGSFKHCLTIQWILDNCKCDNLLLFDCDTILKRNIDFLNSKYITIAQVVKEPTFPMRFAPYIQYFNVKMINNRIKYFDTNRMFGGSCSISRYDTGCSFYEDVIKNNLPYGKIKINDYVDHIKGGTFKNDFPQIRV